MRNSLYLAVLILIGFGFSSEATNNSRSAAPVVVVTIAPLHSLVASIMDGVGSPALLIPGNHSPHDFTLSPSQAKRLHTADIVISASDRLEGFMARVAIGAATRRITMENLKGIRLHKERAPLPQDSVAANQTIDPHLWLDIGNAAIFAQAVGDALQANDPTHATLYRQNTKRLITRLEALDKDLAERLRPVLPNDSIPYIAYHDGYQYFETRYDLPRMIFLTAHPESGQTPHVAQAIDTMLEKKSLRCLFTSPEFNVPALRKLAVKTNAKTYTLDAEGSSYPLGKEMYFGMIQDLANAFGACAR